MKKLLYLYYCPTKDENEVSQKFHRDFILTYNHKCKERGIDAEADSLNIAAYGSKEKFVELLEDCPYDIIFDRITHVLNENWGLMTRLAAIDGTLVLPKGPYNMYNNKGHDYHVIWKLIKKGIIDCNMPKTTLVLTSDWARAKDGKLTLTLDKEFEKVGGEFPVYLKQAFGGGWQHVYKCEDMNELVEKYHFVKDKHMVLQENVEYVEFVRCFVFGMNCVRVVKYDPAQPLHARYVTEGNFLPDPILNRIKKAAEDICKALGYYINSVEFGVTDDGDIFAIDFTNETIDMNPQTVTDEFYTKNLHDMTDFFVDITANPVRNAIYPTIQKAFEINGDAEA